MEQECIDLLVSKKDEIRKKLFETFDYCKISKQLKFLEIIFFKNASKLIDDPEFDKLIKKYEDVNELLFLNINFYKNNEE